MVRFAMPRIAAAVLMTCISAAGVSAQEAPAPTLREAVAASALPLLVGEQLPAVARSTPGRPGTLVPLYVSFGVLQVLDTHSTTRALARGAVEANPMMKGIAGNQVGLLAVKGAGTAGVVFVTEKMWKRNRTAAVVFMVATNSAMAWVVQRNYQVR
ncbi:hypothetical protein BH23ACI1_BH23ACI1_13590 [soil metagenome]|nr:hypothetical protein [Acidobacteriota bacterium]